MESLKKCSRCQQVLPVGSFGPRAAAKDGLQSLCKPCNCEQAKSYYHNNNLAQVYGERAKTRRAQIRRALVVVKEAAGCCLCGETTSVCLDFHHKDRNEKEAMVSEAGRAIKDIVAEAEKCEVLCANCHRKVHANLATITTPRDINFSPLYAVLNMVKRGRQKKHNGS